jgi:hypothetical protein
LVSGGRVGVNPRHVVCNSFVINVRFQVLTAASMMFRAVFWVVLPCKMIVDLTFQRYVLPPSSGMNKPRHRKIEVI